MQVGRGSYSVELRGFEPLTFSLRRLLHALVWLRLACAGSLDCARFRVGGTHLADLGSRRSRSWPRESHRPDSQPSCSSVFGVTGSRGHRGATRSAIDAGRRRANPRASGRWLEVSGVAHRDVATAVLKLRVSRSFRRPRHPFFVSGARSGRGARGRARRARPTHLRTGPAHENVRR